MNKGIISDKFKRGILIVEDEPDLLSLYKVSINRFGFENVFLASDGIDALSLLAQHRDSIYLIILDIRMAHMGGMEVIQHLTNVHDYPVGIIVVTAYGDPVTAVKVLSSGNDFIVPFDYLSKPVGGDVLFEKIENAMDAIHRKRGSYDADGFASQLQSLPEIKKDLDEIKSKLDDPKFQKPSFFEQLGVDLAKIILIALAFVALMSVGAADLIRQIFQIS